MGRDHRRLLAVLLSLFAMGLASAGNAGPLCAADGSDGSALCALPAVVQTDALYDAQHTAAPSLGGLAGDPADGRILLPGQPLAVEPAPAKGLLLGATWTRSEPEDVVNRR